MLSRRPQRTGFWAKLSENWPSLIVTLASLLFGIGMAVESVHSQVRDLKLEVTNLEQTALAAVLSNQKTLDEINKRLASIEEYLRKPR